MGYETRVYIGTESFTGNDFEKGELIIEDGEAYKPLIKDGHGDFIPTGKKKTYFQVMAMIDLCKCGYESNISEIDFKNYDEDHYWYYYAGSTEINEDCYGIKPKPIPIKIVLEALKKDNAEEEYRRYTWAIALLESMADDSENLKVMFYGH